MMENEWGKQDKEENNWCSDRDFILKMMQSSAQKYGLDATEQELSQLIEKSIKEVAKRSEGVYSDPRLNMLYQALPALIRSRDALREFQQLQANASHMGSYELRHSLNTLQQKPVERGQQTYPHTQDYVVPRPRDLGDIWLEAVASPAQDETGAHEQNRRSKYISHAGRLLQQQITPNYRRSTSKQQVIYLLSDPRLFQSNSDIIHPTNYWGTYMLDDPQRLYDYNTFPQGVRYVGRTSNLRKRMKLHIANGHDSGTATKRTWIAELLEEQLHPVVIIAEGTAETTYLVEEREYRWILQSLRMGASLTNIEANYRHLTQMCQTATIESFLSEPFNLETPSPLMWQLLEAYGCDLRDRDDQRRKKKVS